MNNNFIADALIFHSSITLLVFVLLAQSTFLHQLQE